MATQKSSRTPRAGDEKESPEGYHEVAVKTVDVEAYPPRPYAEACSAEHARFLRDHDGAPE